LAPEGLRGLNPATEGMSSNVFDVALPLFFLKIVFFFSTQFFNFLFPFVLVFFELMTSLECDPTSLVRTSDQGLPPETPFPIIGPSHFFYTRVSLPPPKKYRISCYTFKLSCPGSIFHPPRFWPSKRACPPLQISLDVRLFQPFSFDASLPPFVPPKLCVILSPVLKAVRWSTIHEVPPPVLSPTLIKGLAPRVRPV